MLQTIIRCTAGLHTAVHAARTFHRTWRNGRLAAADDLQWNAQAPEVMVGQPAGPPADVYSFGVLLWQLCTGGDPTTDRQRLLE